MSCRRVFGKHCRHATVDDAENNSWPWSTCTVTSNRCAVCRKRARTSRTRASGAITRWWCRWRTLANASPSSIVLGARVPRMAPGRRCIRCSRVWSSSFATSSCVATVPSIAKTCARSSSTTMPTLPSSAVLTREGPNRSMRYPRRHSGRFARAPRGSAMSIAASEARSFVLAPRSVSIFSAFALHHALRSQFSLLSELAARQWPLRRWQRALSPRALVASGT